LLLDDHIWFEEEILDGISLHLGVSNWTLLDSVTQKHNSFLFVSISFLEPGNQLFLLLLQNVIGLGYLLSSGMRIINTLVVKWTVFVHHGAVHLPHIRLGKILAILHGLVLFLQIFKVVVPVSSDSIFNLGFLSLDRLKLAMVPVFDTEPIALDIVGGSCPHVVKDTSVLVLDKFLISP
jgi:hypothetical protein